MDGPIAFALVGFLGALALLGIVRAASRAVRRRVIHRRLARASEGERRAAALLAHAGYDVIAAQVAAQYALRVDGELRSFEVRADYLARKRGRRFVVEVKTGDYAPRLDTVATRRQLLEYSIAFRAGGVLLVDAEADLIHVVELPREESGLPRVPLGAVFVICVGLGTLASRAIAALPLP
jgi:hypothetical protein